MKLINKIRIKLSNMKHNIRVINDSYVNDEIYKILIKKNKVIFKKQLGDSHGTIIGKRLEGQF
jgi:hypothetical protein